MSDVTFEVRNDEVGRPVHVQILDASHTSYGEAVLGPAKRSHRFELPQGPYIVQVERAGSQPEQFVRMLKDDDRLDLTQRADTAERDQATQREFAEASRPRVSPRARARRPAAFGRQTTTGPNIRISASRPPSPDSEFLGSILSQYAGRRQAELNVGGESVVRERSGFRLPEKQPARTPERPAMKDSGGRRRAKLRSRFRLTIAAHVTVDQRLELSVADSTRVPGDLLTVRTGHTRIEIDEGYRAPLLWLQERKSNVADARFIAIPLFSGSVSLGFDAENKQVVRVASGNDGVDALLALLSSSVSAKADAVAEQVFSPNRGGFDDGMSPDHFAYRLLKDKFLDPYAAAVAGYFMVRFNKFDLLRDWSRNLADYFPFMSDGCIIEGWRRLIVRGYHANPPWPRWRVEGPPAASLLNPEPNAKRPDDPIADAALRFLEAHARGLPTFHYGLEKHLEGLIFCFDRTEDAALRENLATAIDDMSSASRRAHSSAGLTTITSVS